MFTIQKLWQKLFLLSLIFLLGCARSVAASVEPVKKVPAAAELSRNESAAKLFIPPLLDTAEGKVVLRAQRANHKVTPSGSAGPSMGYNGPFLGPSILLHEGRQAQIEIVNELGEGTTFHSHGALIPGAADGGPHKIIAADSSWLLQFQVKQQAATLWYHPHKMGSTAAQVWQGLGGLYIVHDSQSKNLSLPQTYGIDDIPLVIQERLLDDNGQILSYEQASSGHMTVMNGISGNVFLVNGQLRPELQAAYGWLRLRLLNASNASSYRFSLQTINTGHKVNFYRIASEQGLLAAPEERQFLDLATGSRAEVMLQLPEQGGKIQLLLAPWSRNLSAPRSQKYPIMNILVDSTRRAEGRLPPRLRPIPEHLQQESPPQVRDFQLQMMTGQSSYGINGQSFAMAAVQFNVPKGRYEVWRFSTDMLGHPVHIHGVQFRILQSAWLPNGSHNWRDTFTLGTQGKALVLLRFLENASSDNPYMLHCHMLEHEDAGMMASFTVS